MGGAIWYVDLPAWKLGVFPVVVPIEHCQVEVDAVANQEVPVLGAHLICVGCGEHGVAATEVETVAHVAAIDELVGDVRVGQGDRLVCRFPAYFVNCAGRGCSNEALFNVVQGDIGQALVVDDAGGVQHPSGV